METLSGGATLTTTRLVGRYLHGRRVGIWSHYDASGHTLLNTFTLDDQGSGEELLRDAAGHSRRGSVVRGDRDGNWTIYDEKGALVATETWLHGKFVKRVGKVPWDPPMLDPSDACPSKPTRDAEDGCPSP